MNKKGYKVVYPHNGKLFSAIEEDCGVEYFIEKTTRPQRDCGPLCVFDSLHQARTFVHLNQFFEKKIYQCSYLKSSLDGIWDKYDKGSFHPLTTLPDGTVLADEVILISEVE